MTNFHHVDPSLPSLYRAVILFGLNTASYKFSLGKSLIELADADAEFVPIETLARYFSKHVADHVADAPKQSTRKTQVGYFETCRRFNLGEIDEGELVHQTVKNAFDDVIDRFHIVNREELDRRFYIYERKASPSGIRLTDDLYRLVKEARGAELMPEIEARWRLVETAWELNISRSLITVQHDVELEKLFVENFLRRRNVTSTREALNGYQRGKCFFCYDRISVISGLPDIAHVDHFFPHVLKRHGMGSILDGVWNLVLACKSCNGIQEKGAKVPHTDLLERLHKRNEYLIDSNHPLKETLIHQTGRKKAQRIDFLQNKYDVAKDALAASHPWKPVIKGDPKF